MVAAQVIVWDANPAQRGEPDDYNALPQWQQDQLLAWVEEHVGKDRWIGRVEYDVIDMPLLRVFFLVTEPDGDRWPYCPPIEVPLRRAAPAFVGAP